jgi:hypothetical protein
LRIYTDAGEQIALVLRRGNTNREVANADLIATAPDLLRALCRLVAVVTVEENRSAALNDAIKDALAVIAATGLRDGRRR